MLELVGGFAQLGLACAAVRRSLGLDRSTAACDQNDPTTGQPDNPWICTDTAVTDGLPYIPNVTVSGASTNCPPAPASTACPGTFPAQPLLATVCPGGGALIEQVTVHYKPPNSTSWVVATATAVPASQFLG